MNMGQRRRCCQLMASCVWANDAVVVGLWHHEYGTTTSLLSADGVMSMGQRRRYCRLMASRVWANDVIIFGLWRHEYGPTMSLLSAYGVIIIGLRPWRVNDQFHRNFHDTIAGTNSLII